MADAARLREVRVRTMLEEVRAGRVGRDEASIREYMARTFSIPQEERAKLAKACRRRLEADPEPGTTRKRLPEVKVLRGKEIVREAAKLYRQDPGLTARRAHELLQENGHRMGIAFGSFPALWTDAKKVVDEGREDLLEDQRPAARRARATAEKRKSGARTKPRRKKKPRAPKPAPDAPQEPVAEEPGPTSTDVANVTTGARTVHAEEADRVTVRLGGQYLDARKVADGWALEFRGTVPDELMHQLGRIALERARAVALQEVAE